MAERTTASDAAAADPHDPLRAAMAELEDALRAFEAAYLAWATADGADAVMRRGLLTQAEVRLDAARASLAALEEALAAARQGQSPTE